MKHYYIYNNATDRIELVGTTIELFETEPGYVMYESTERVDVNQYYHDPVSDTLIERPDLTLTVSKSTITADGTDETSISGLPNPTTVAWPDGQEDLVTDGSIEFSVDLEGSYIFRLESFPFKTQEITIEAVTTT